MKKNIRDNSDDYIIQQYSGPGIIFPHISIHYNQYDKTDLMIYKDKLMTLLLKEGINTEYISHHDDIKIYMHKFVNELIIDRAKMNKIGRITYKIANFDIDTSDVNHSNIKYCFPIINKFIGHNLVETFYFALREDMYYIKKITINSWKRAVPTEEELIEMDIKEQERLDRESKRQIFT